MNNLEYVLLNETVNVIFSDVSCTDGIEVLFISDITHEGKSILDKVVKSNHFDSIVSECKVKASQGF